jgi:glutamyl-tRNA reductase
LLVSQFYDRELPPYDAVFLATDRAVAFFTKKDALRVVTRFQGRSKQLLIIDLGVPRNSDPNVSQVKNVKLLQVSDLLERAKHGEEQRKRAIRHAKPIIHAHASQLSRKLFVFLEQNRILSFRKDLENALTKRKIQLLEAIEKKHQNSQLDKTLDRVFHEIIHISQKHFERALMEGKP